MNSMVTWYIIGMIIGSCVTLTAVSAVNRDSGGMGNHGIRRRVYRRDAPLLV